MNTITSAFAACRSHNRAALIPYLMAGYPDETTFVALVDAVFDAGADLLEIGIPFSDPLADGPTIQRAAQTALSHGVTVEQTLDMLARIRNTDSKPLVIMSYLNPLLRYGLDRFAAEAARIGVRGLIVPDVIIEESATLERTMRTAGIDLVHLIAPTSPPDRRASILQRSRGFVYLVSIAGVTGARRELPASLTTMIRAIRTASPVPVAVGFGISTPEQAASVGREADGVVVGSALIDCIDRAGSPSASITRAADFIATLRRGLNRSETHPAPEQLRRTP
ncbi:tryptophan synthase subunit alpha [candidate division GN15 bacterium]|nr:tryptophan synthase subunit alpha [candidate division GN15 bacterium]